MSLTFFKIAAMAKPTMEDAVSIAGHAKNLGHKASLLHNPGNEEAHRRLNKLYQDISEGVLGQKASLTQASTAEPAPVSKTEVTPDNSGESTIHTGPK